MWVCLKDLKHYVAQEKLQLLICFNLVLKSRQANFNTFVKYLVEPVTAPYSKKLSQLLISGAQNGKYGNLEESL